MICPRCGAAVEPNKKFCGDCGTPLPWSCAACGSDNPPDKRFCGDCGAARASAPSAVKPAAAPAPSPERRLLSVMFIDLVGSSEIGRRLDPEDAREVISAFHATVRGYVGQLDGFVARYEGDGTLVYFGYPQAHEADPERAIRTGLTIVEGVASLNTLAGPPGTLRVRIGIDTGFVVAGDLIGSGSALEAAIVGDTPNMAKRLQASAEPGTIVISDATQQMVGRFFEYREIELRNLKGRPGPERAWIVLGESLVESRYEALRRGQTSLVNRSEELDLLLRRWEQVKSGEGRVLLLTGDPGMGKSRLIVALEQAIAATVHQRVRLTCSPHHTDYPLHPIVRYIERAADFRRGDSPAARWDKLANLLAIGSSSEDTALLADLVSIPLSTDLLKALTPQRRKARTFATIMRQINILAENAPMLILVEDIHWADPSTLELLEDLVEVVQQRSMFLVVTARPGVHPSWASHPHVTVQALSGLSRATTATLIRQVAGGRELPREVIDKITASADNVPLFIEELTKSVLETIQAAGEDGAPGKPPSVDAVPRSLHSSLMARLDRLSAGKEIAQIGAVIGREFSFEILQALSSRSSKQLVNALAELAKAEIIITHGQPPFASYTFRHALVQDAAYASLLRDRRRAIHLRVAEEMVKDTASETAEPQSIARHFAEAGDPDRAIEYYAKAAERATGRFALAEMVNYLRNGLRQIALLPESTQRHRRELTLQLTLGRTLIDHEGANSEAVRTTFERARELCLTLDELELLPKVYDGLVVNYYFIHSEPEKIFHYTKEMIALHRRTGDPRALLTTWRAAFLANFLLGRFALARQDMEKLIEMYDEERDGPQSGMTTRDPKVSTCTFLGICLTILGQVDAGAAMSLEGVRHAKTLRHPVSLNLGLRRACVQGMLAGDAQRVIELSGELAALRAEFETYKGSWEGTFFEDWAQMWTQPNAERFDRVQSFLRQLDRTRNWGLLPFYMASAAELSGRHGNLDTAAALLERADELINTTGARWCEAEVLRLRARFSARNQEEAITLLRASVAKAREQEAELWESRAAADLAEVLSHQGTVSRSQRS